jgi:hypothetical protein
VAAVQEIEKIRIDVPTLAAAKRLSDALRSYRTRLVDTDGEWSVEVDRDREFNELLLGVLKTMDAYLATDPLTGLRLVVEGRSYPLHAPARGGAERVSVPSD